ncbi:MAG: glycoside hydrolase family 3 N-terminal domain-containing protein [Myxococcota bacterium]
MTHRVDAWGEATSLADRKRRAGQRLVVGWPARGVDDDLRRLCAEIRPAGFVLFARNLEEPAQIRELTRELASLAQPHDPALVCVDQEGGRVQRVRETVWPPAQQVARAELTADVSRAMARELRALGIHLNLAPVADLGVDGGAAGVGDRAFGDDPAEVARHVEAWVRAHQAEGVIATAKHFPGLGHAGADPHRALPEVPLELPDLRGLALPPFAAAVRAGVGVVMSGHVVCPALDEERPATLSPRVIPALLREELGYDGVVMSDDLEMGAMSRFALAEQVRGATEASVDLLLVTDPAELQAAAFRELVLAQEEDPMQERRAIDAVARIDALRVRFLGRPRPPVGLEAVGSLDHKVLAEQARARGR